MASKLALTLAAASSVSGLALRGDGCTLTLTTSGGVSYPVGQHNSGQTRAGSAITPTEFTLNGGSLTDSQGRGCWWTPPAKVLQCDVNQAPEAGFEVGCDGAVSFNGQTTFYECDAGENDEVNIYLAQDDSAQNCKEITLTASGCASGDCAASSSSSEAASYSATAPVETTAPAETSAPATSAPQIVSTIYSTTTISVPGSCSAAPPSLSTVFTTTTSTVTSCASTVSECPTETVPGPTETVSQTIPGPTETVSGPAETVPGPTETVPGPTETLSETVPGPTETVSQTIPGPTETAPGPTYTVSGPGETVTASSPPETETEVCTETESVTPSTAPATAPSSAPSAPAASTPAVPSSSAPAYPTTSAAAPSSAAPSSSAAYPTTAPQPTTLSSVTSKASSASASVPATSTSPGQSAGIPAPSDVNIPDSCPGDVSNAGEFNLPALIIPVDSSSPDTAAGTSYFGEVSATKSSVFDFNIPAEASGKTCNLVFLFPEQDTLETSSYTFSGSGALDFSKLSSAVDQQTTYANVPRVAQDLGQFTVAPGNAYNVASFDCPSGEEYSVKVAVAEGGDTSLRFFQDYNPCPIGLFITTS